MNRADRQPFRWLALGVVAATVALFAADRAGAQDSKLKLHYSFELDANHKEVKSGDILSVRPNVKLPLYLYLESTLKEDLDFNVELSRVTKKGPVAFLTTTMKLPGEKGGNTTKQALSGWAVAGAPAKPPVPMPGVVQPPALPAPELEAPFEVELKVWQTGKEAQVFKLGVTFLQPKQYLDATPLKFDEKKREFAVEISRKPNATLPFVPPVELNLDLDNSPHPLLVRPIPRTSALLIGQLSPKKTKILLRAGALEIRNPAQGQKRGGPVFITADGCQRAFAFLAEFANDDPTLFQDTVVRLAVGDFVRADKTLTFRVETDNVDKWFDTTVKVAMDLNDDKKFTDDETQTFPTARQMRVQLLPPAADGAVLFQTLVQDWEVTFPIDGMAGPFALQAWLETSKGDKISFNGADVTDSRTVIIDGTAPDKVGFFEMNKVYPSGKVLPAVATGLDNESDVKEVWFGVAPIPIDPKGVIDPKWLKEAVPGKKDAKRKNIWTADLDLGPDTKGPVELGVMFVNRAGMTTTTTWKITLVDPKLGGPTGKKLAAIYATIAEGELLQNDLDVVLLDKDGKEVKKEKTATVKDEKGKEQRGLAVFKDLEPGKYTVVSAKSATNRVGSATLEVKEGETKAVTVKLFVP